MNNINLIFIGNNRRFISYHFVLPNRWQTADLEINLAYLQNSTERKWSFCMRTSGLFFSDSFQFIFSYTDIPHIFLKISVYTSISWLNIFKRLLLKKWRISWAHVRLVFLGTRKNVLWIQEVSHPSLIPYIYPMNLYHKFIVTWPIFKLTRLTPAGMSFAYLGTWLYEKDILFYIVNISTL